MPELNDLIWLPLKAVTKVLAADPNVLHDHEDGTGYTLLHLAVRDRKRSIAEACINMGSDVNARSASGYTPLYMACGGADVWMVRMLLKRGAQIDAADDMGVTPLAMAARSGHVVSRTKVIALLEEAGACRDLLVSIWLRDDVALDAALRSAASHRPLYFEHVVPEYASMWFNESLLWEPLQDAEDAVDMLVHWSKPSFERVLGLGADIDAVGLYGAPTAMDIAVSLGVSAIEFLIEHGADVNREYAGKTPLERAVSPEAREVLRQHGAHGKSS